MSLFNRLDDIMFVFHKACGYKLNEIKLINGSWTSFDGNTFSNLGVTLKDLYNHELTPN